MIGKCGLLIRERGEVIRNAAKSISRSCWYNPEKHNVPSIINLNNNELSNASSLILRIKVIQHEPKI